MEPNINNKDHEQREDEEEDQYGVLLYYKYTRIPDLDKLLTFYHSNCNSLSLSSAAFESLRLASPTPPVWHFLIKPSLSLVGGQLDKESRECDRELVLLDARNLYETRIGKFNTPDVENCQQRNLMPP